MSSRCSAIRFASIAACCALGGCDPVVNVYGSIFPGWLIALFAGVAGTILLRMLFAAIRIERHLGPLILVYPCLAALIACAVWLACFRA